MTYVDPNFKTKKALREAIRDGLSVNVYEPGLGDIPENGTVYLEGPHAPAMHTWYAVGTMKDHNLVKVV